MTVRMQHRRGTAAQWTSTNPTLYAGEMGVETDTLKVKMGSGAAWNSTPYLELDKSLIDAKGDLLVGTGNDAVGRLAVGSNGALLVADSTQTAGVRWTTARRLEGTGAPEGVVTAPPGSTWLQTDSTVDVKGWIRWVKATGTGNTGWVAGPEADTGWRDVTANVTSAGTTKYPNIKLAVRRRGDFLEYIAYTGTGTTDGAASTTVYDAPIGFRFSVLFTYRSAAGSTIQAGNGQSAAPVAIYTSGPGIVIAQPATAGIGNQVSGYLSGNARPDAEGAWPTSLPGTAV